MSASRQPLPVKRSFQALQFDRAISKARSEIRSRLVSDRARIKRVIHGLEEVRKHSDYWIENGQYQEGRPYARPCDRDQASWWEESADLLESTGFGLVNLANELRRVAGIARTMMPQP